MSYRNQNASREHGVANRLSLTLLVLWAVSLAFAGCGSNSTDPIPDPPLAVLSVTPVDGATGVSVHVNIDVVFNRSVDASTIDATTLTLQAVDTDHIVDGATVTLDPTAPLSAGTAYIVTVRTSVTDVSGMSLEAEFTSIFTTIESTGDPVAVVGSTQNVNLGETVTLDASGSSEPNSLPMNYLWTQVGGLPVGPIPDAVNPIFTAPDTVGALVFELIVQSEAGQSDPETMTIFACVDTERALFVSAAESVVGSGTRGDPFGNIWQAYQQIDNVHSYDVYMTEGSYPGPVILRDLVSIYGGFARETWVRGISLTPTVIDVSNSHQDYAIFGFHVTNVTLDGLQVSHSPVDGMQPSSIVVALNGGSNCRLSNLVITAGNGISTYDRTPIDPPFDEDDGLDGTCTSSASVAHEQLKTNRHIP